jgi:hypothetical protein
MQPTPLRGDKIAAILTPRCSKTAFPIYWCGAADGQSVRPQYKHRSSTDAVSQARLNQASCYNAQHKLVNY